MNEQFAIPLISKNGIRGKVLEASRTSDDAPNKTVIFETGRQASVPAHALHLRSDGSYYLDLTVDPRPPEPENSSPVADPGSVVIPRIEEQATITRRVVETGRVRVRKSITQERATINEPTIHEEYAIKRVPMDRVVSETLGPRVEGDVTIIPVYEERTVTVKQLFLVEEIHLTKTRREESRSQTILLRKERIDIERT